MTPGAMSREDRIRRRIATADDAVRLIGELLGEPYASPAEACIAVRRLSAAADAMADELGRIQAAVERANAATRRAYEEER